MNGERIVFLDHLPTVSKDDTEVGLSLGSLPSHTISDRDGADDGGSWGRNGLEAHGNLIAEGEIVQSIGV